MKPAAQWISEHGQSGDYPLEGVPVGCFTEAQIREIQEDAIYSQLSEIQDVITKFLKEKENEK